MHTLEALERGYGAAPPAPLDQGTVRGICLRLGQGVHRAVSEAELSVVEGVVGDRWIQGERPERHSQVTLMNATVGRLLSHPGTAAHESGDNFLVELDLSEQNLPVGSRLLLGSAVLEITWKPHRGCKKFSARFGPAALEWVNLETRLAARLRGVHAEVLEGGRAAVGGEVRVLRRGP